MTVALNLVTKQLGDKLPQSDLQTVLKLLVPSVVFPNLLKCVQIALTLPVTSASCERSFSAMNLIKTYLRNRTEDVRLSDLATLFVHKERACTCLGSRQDIDTFANRMDRRMQFS